MMAEKWKLWEMVAVCSCSLLIVGSFMTYFSPPVARSTAPVVAIASTTPVVDEVDNLGLRNSQYCIATKGVVRSEIALQYGYLSKVSGDESMVDKDYWRSLKSMKINNDLWNKKNCDALGYGPIVVKDEKGWPTFLGERAY